jgi:molybdopterin molybdotransferase
MSGCGDLTLAQALARLKACVAPVAGTETIPIAAADRRVLAAEVVSALDLPAFDNAAMDGYALHAADLAAANPALVLAGHAYAGHGYAGELAPGQCVRITTGAPIPQGTAAVVIQEDTRADGAAVRVLRAPETGANIRFRGEHIRRGQSVLARGRWLDPAAIGLAAAVGAASLQVVRRLRVAVLSTGDELADPPAPLAASASYDANRPFLLAAVQRRGFDALDLGICADRPADFEQRLRMAVAAGADALVVSGGAAQGDADIVRQAGGISFLPLNFRPGRGVAWATLDCDGARLLLLGLPGNSVACVVMFHLLAAPLLLHLAGGEARLPEHLPLPLAEGVQLRGGRIDYRRGCFARDAHGRLCVRLARDQGSAMLRGWVDADALVALGPRPSYAAGELVDTLVLAALG